MADKEQFCSVELCIASSFLRPGAYHRSNLAELDSFSLINREAQ
jgi:hypothetical protein